MAKLAFDFEVPDRWTASFTDLLHATGFGGTTELRITGEVEIVDGVPCLRSFAWEADSPLHPRIFNLIDAAEILDAGVRAEVMRSNPAPWNGGRVGAFTDAQTDVQAFDDRYDGYMAHVAAAATRPRRRRQITPELLAQVVALYESGGIQAVEDQLHYSARYAWRLLARARKELS